MQVPTFLTLLTPVEIGFILLAIFIVSTIASAIFSSSKKANTPAKKRIKNCLLVAMFASGIIGISYLFFLISNYPSTANLITRRTITDAQSEAADHATLNSDYTDALSLGKTTVKSALETTYADTNIAFDWNALENLTSVEDVVSWQDEDNSDSAVAMYDHRRSCIYLFPEFYELSADEQSYTLLHEIIHSVLNDSEETTCSLQEGITDYLVLKVYQANGLESSFTAYPNELLVVESLIEIYGEEQVLNSACNGQLASLIDTDTALGMTKAMDISLSSLRQCDQIDSATYYAKIPYEILANAAKNRGADAETLANLATIKKRCQDLNGLNF